jgi:hypothetical protein
MSGHHEARVAGPSGAVNRHDLDRRRFVWLAYGLAEPQNKLPGLQIARAAAALGIAYFHSWHVTMPFPPGTSYPIPFLKEYGWIAVNFFFSISGFVICLVATKPNFRPLQFLVRRVFRLYPLWIVTSLVFLGLSVIALDAQFAGIFRILPHSAADGRFPILRRGLVSTARTCLLCLGRVAGAKRRAFRAVCLFVRWRYCRSSFDAALVSSPVCQLLSELPCGNRCLRRQWLYETVRRLAPNRGGNWPARSIYADYRTAGISICAILLARRIHKYRVR